MNRTIVVLALVALTGCSGTAKGLVPAGPAAHLTAGGRAASDSSTAMPGDSSTAMPGDSSTAMPGATFACAPFTSSGSARCTIAVNVNIAPITNPNTPAALIPGFHPADLQAAYALPAQNAGATVAIVDAYDDPTAESDLAAYRAAFGLPPCTAENGCFRKVDQRSDAGGAATPNAGWSQEIALDLDMVSAVCPRCSILLVEADSTLLDDLGTGVDTAARLGATAISNSYYAAEWSNESAEDAHYAHPGIAITASAGDTGRPSYPAASAHVTSVGGTSLARNGGAWSETPWTYGGRGCSAYVARPSWQAGSSCATRSTVDVAAVADPQTGVAFFSTASGGWVVAGGTSVGAPIVAAAYALSGNPRGPAYSYAHAAGFRPVGSPGYALATGLGSPLGIGGL